MARPLGGLFPLFLSGARRHILYAPLGRPRRLGPRRERGPRTAQPGDDDRGIPEGRRGEPAAPTRMIAHAFPATRVRLGHRVKSGPDDGAGACSLVKGGCGMIVRIARRTRGSTPIANEALRDGRLSYQARGVLCFLLSFPDEATLGADDVWRAVERAERGEDLNRIREALSELEARGYLEHVEEPREGGQR